MDDFSSETYTGLTKGTFKERLYGYNSDFRHREQEKSTRLSTTYGIKKTSKYNTDLNGKYLGKLRATIQLQEIADYAF